MSTSISPAIIHPAVDPWLVGGLSIVVLTIFIVASSTIPAEMVLGNFLVLTVLLNGTHFMASYALLYSSRASIQRYPVASMYLPAGLLILGGLALWLAAGPLNNDSAIKGILLIASLYLALHYTGQVWGMMASYAFMNGIRYSHTERRALRISLRTMAAWQMVWALSTSPSYIPETLRPLAPHLMNMMNVLAVLSFIVGCGALASLTIRHGSRPPASLILPFASLYTWYLFLSIYPQSIFWVQIFHALQYLSFPFRVQANRISEHASRELQRSRQAHLLRYSLALAFASLFVFVGIDKALNYPNGGFEAYFLVFVSLVNIHHYFIDGCIWHISNPEVRADLFAHLKRINT